jgi:hypothetical protein
MIRGARSPVETGMKQRTHLRSFSLRTLTGDALARATGGVVQTWTAGGVTSVYNTTTGDYFKCINGNWFLVTGSGLVPSNNPT